MELEYASSQCALATPALSNQPQTLALSDAQIDLLNRSNLGSLRPSGRENLRDLSRFKQQMWIHFHPIPLLDPHSSMRVAWSPPIFPSGDAPAHRIP